MGLCKQTMIDSYRNVSFYGERRGAEDYDYYSKLLRSDLETLGESQGNYESKFIDKCMNIYHTQSRCASTFIVGSGNFNVRRHAKTLNAHQNAQDHFWHWREKYFKAVNRVRTPSPEDEIESAIADIDRLTHRKEAMKFYNKTYKKDLEAAKEALEGTNLLERLTSYYDSESFPTWAITSLTTKIRERNKKILIMKNRIEAKNAAPDKVFLNGGEFNGGKVYIDNDRVIIEHDDKPSREVIDQIKGKGFRFSPKTKTWVRKHTMNARYDANNLLKAWI